VQEKVKKNNDKDIRSIQPIGSQYVDNIIEIVLSVNCRIIDSIKEH